MIIQSRAKKQFTEKSNCPLRINQYAISLNYQKREEKMHWNK